MWQIRVRRWTGEDIPHSLCTVVNANPPTSLTITWSFRECDPSLPLSLPLFLSFPFPLSLCLSSPFPFLLPLPLFPLPLSPKSRRKNYQMWVAEVVTTNNTAPPSQAQAKWGHISSKGHRKWFEPGGSSTSTKQTTFQFNSVCVCLGVMSAYKIRWQIPP